MIEFAAFSTLFPGDQGVPRTRTGRKSPHHDHHKDRLHSLFRYALTNVLELKHGIHRGAYLQPGTSTGGAPLHLPYYAVDRN